MSTKSITLHYAVRDAERVYEVLRDLGGFEPSHMLSLPNASAASMRAALIDLGRAMSTRLACAAANGCSSL